MRGDGNVSDSSGAPQPEATTAQLTAASASPAAGGPHRGLSRRARVLAVLGGLLVILAAGYLWGWARSGDLAPRNAEVAGIAIGGLTSEQATQRLTTDLLPAAQAAITMTGAAEPVLLDPAEAGLGVDLPATLIEAGLGRSWRPVHVWRSLTGGGRTAPVLVVDTDRLSSALTSRQSAFAVAAVDAGVTLDGVQITRTPARQGSELDLTGTAGLVREAWSQAVRAAASTPAVAAALTSSEPAVTDQVATQFVDATLSPMLQPVVVSTDRGEFTLTAEQIAASTSITTTGGRLAAGTDWAGLHASAGSGIAGLKLTAPVDAGFTFSNDRPTVVPSVDGEGLSLASFTAAVQPVLSRATDRVARATIETVPAAFTTAQAEALGITEVTGEFTTYWQQHTPYRNTNLGQAAKSMNGTLVRPGETFSYNKVLGERTPEAGYVKGGVLTGGRIVENYGGGVSQGATTTFNAAFFAGMKDIEHHPHGLWFDRYPPGREATVSWGSLDLRWQNDTPYGVLVQAFVVPSTSAGRPGSITVRLWSTRTFEVKSSELVKSNFTNGGSRVITGDPSCQPQAAKQGFDVNYSRLFYQDGALVRTEKFFWRYSAGDAITCR